MNINVKNLYRKKEILFDGSERNYMDFIHHYLCPACSSDIVIKPSESNTFYALDEVNRNELASVIKGLASKNTPAFSPYYTYKQLGLTQDIASCSNQHSFLIITANGEFQPGRYIVINLGIFKL